MRRLAVRGQDSRGCATLDAPYVSDSPAVSTLVSRALPRTAATSLAAALQVLERDRAGLAQAAACQAAARALAPYTEWSDPTVASDAFALVIALSRRAKALAAARGLDRATWVWAARCFTAASRYLCEPVEPTRARRRLHAPNAADDALGNRLLRLLPRMLEEVAVTILDQRRSLAAAVDEAVGQLVDQLDPPGAPAARAAVEVATERVREVVGEVVVEPTIERHQALIVAETRGFPALTSVTREVPLLLAAAPVLVDVRPEGSAVRRNHALASVPVEVAKHLRSVTDAAGGSVVVASAPADPTDTAGVYRCAARFTEFAGDPATGRYGLPQLEALAASWRAALALARSLDGQ